MQKTEIKWFNARRKQSTANEKKITFRLKNDTPAQEQAYRNPSTDCTMDATKNKARSWIGLQHKLRAFFKTNKANEQ